MNDTKLLLLAGRIEMLFHALINKKNTTKE